jgi:hypothetical protein
MENHINQIEKFLRGQMSEKEEAFFKASLKTNVRLHSFAFIVAYLLKTQKS